MKKIILVAAIAVFAFAACNKDNGNENGGGNTVLEATFELSGEIGDLTYGEPVAVEGTLTSASPIDAVSFTGVDDEGNAVGEEQKYEASGTEISGEFFPDTKDMTQLQVTLYSGDAKASFNFPTGTVTGDAKGDVYINNTAQFMADTLVFTHENSPELFPEENTGNGTEGICLPVCLQSEQRYHRTPVRCIRSKRPCNSAGQYRQEFRIFTGARGMV